MKVCAWSNRRRSISTARAALEAKRLSRVAATLYAAESMRLTTRLMQVASWLLLQRAANSGEMTRDQVAIGKVQGTARHQLGQRQRTWLGRAAGRVSRTGRTLAVAAGVVRRMDEEIYGSASGPQHGPAPRCSNPVSDQISLLHTAFARG